MTALLSSICLAVAALINLAPMIGVMSAAQISRLYGIDADDPNIEILMRHRAALFGILGAFMLIGAAQSGWFWPALTAGLVSMSAYAAIALLVGEANDALRFVLRMDLIGLGFGLAAGAFRLL